MTTLVACPTPILQFFDNQGNPAVGGSVLTQVGGVNYPTYQDVNGTTALPNPIPLNSRGEVSTAAGASSQLFLTPNTTYTFTLYDANGNQLNQATYINGVVLTAEEIAALTVTVTDNPVIASDAKTAAETAASVTPANYSYAPARADVRRYGVKGDGVTDDTAAIQAAFNVSAHTGQIVWFPAGLTCKTTSQLTYSANVGILMDPTSYIAPSGSNYTALLIDTPLYGRFQLRLEGNGASITGLVLNNPKTSIFDQIVVNGFNGIGIVVSHCWDCTFNHISVESCGNNGTTDLTSLGVGLGVTDNYAFALQDGGDTCNMTHIMRLQVELATAKAIYVSPNTLSCLIDNIHSEQAAAVSGTTTWQIGGNRCTYNTSRFNASGTPSNSTLVLDSANSVYITLFSETDTLVTANSYSGTMSIYGAEIDGTFAMKSGQTGQINVFSASIGTVDASVVDTYVSFWNCYLNGSLASLTDRMYSKALESLGANYTATLTDARKILDYNAASGSTFTIPANATLAFPVGTQLEVINTTGTGTITIACGDTMYLEGSGTTGSRTLADWGHAKITKFGTTQWVIGGTGVT